MEWRLMLIQNADAIIYNNQLIANGNCSNIITINKEKPLKKIPNLMNSNIDSYLPYKENDLKYAYLKKYIYDSDRCNPIINLN
tara:strand:+ start:221 stop:469 length:249 start_codon:yes stop_codon:yes gene_type:complete